MKRSADPSTSLAADAPRSPLHLLFAAPALVSVLLQCQLLPAQVAESVFVYRHGKLSEQAGRPFPSVVSATTSFTSRHGEDATLHVWAALMESATCTPAEFYLQEEA